ncbi:MAG TPA: prepilin-type N-terminal cleavage/methylation domain-containing protein [bacterium]|nr:prepilin-type N-terminal cleavage/methylation domain-containing protein [bacterium]
MRTAVRGYTLVELLIVMAVVSILAATALVSYDEYARKSRVENLKARILDAAVAQERFFTARGRYTSVLSDLLDFGWKDPNPEGVRITTGVFLGVGVNQSFWVAGHTDIDKTLDAYHECWFYPGRTPVTTARVANGFVQLWDDRKNQQTATVPYTTLDGSCK